MSNVSDLSLVQLKRAVQIKEQLEKLQSELSSVLGSSRFSQKSSNGSGMSEATKAKLRASAQKRWATVKAAKPAAAPATKPTTTTGRKPMSAAAKARLSALMKAKWAAKNKGDNHASSPAKKTAPKKTTMSAAAKARLSALAKARWAKVKASGKKSL
jgi:hypothetical protein